MGLETVDPLVQVPSLAWSVLTVVLPALHVFAFLAAAWSVLMSPRLAPGGRLLWIVVLLGVPFLGAIAWFVWGRRARLDQAAAGPE